MAAPTVNDDQTKGLGAGVHWLDFTDSEGVAEYIAMSVATGAAVWRRIAITAADGTLPVARMPVTMLTTSATNVPLTGQTSTFNVAKQNQTISLLHTGTIAAHTVVIPSDANSSIGQELTLFAKSIVTVLTVTATGLTIHGAPLTTLTAGQSVLWQKVSSATWVRLQ